MSATFAVQRQRPGDVQQDWVAWLPNETAQVFEQVRQELAVSCILLGVIVNEGLGSDPNGAAAATAELAVLFSGLFDRMVQHLGIVLGALEEHGRACGTRPNAMPLRPECFRSRHARQAARASRLRSLLSITDRSVFGPKLSGIRRVIAALQSQARHEARAIAAGESGNARARWARLEVLQYDLNTCLQETTIALKSFFCALPDRELPLFRSRLPAGCQQPVLLAGRPPGFWPQ